MIKGQLVFIDQSVDGHFRETVYPVALELDDFATSLDAQSDLKITARSATGASVEFKSRLSDAPLSIEGRASLKEFNLTTLEPYYDDLVGFEVERGQLSGNFNFRVELQPAPGLISVSRGVGGGVKRV